MLCRWGFFCSPLTNFSISTAAAWRSMAERLPANPACPQSKQKDRKINPVFCYLSLKAILSAATFKSTIGHVRAVTAVGSSNTTTTVYDMITARFCCRLIAFFLFIFLVHVFTPSFIINLSAFHSTLKYAYGKLASPISESD